LKKEISYIRTKDIMNNYILSIQDLNSVDLLEYKLKKISKKLYNLRLKRNDICHYIIKEGEYADTEELINYKKFVLYKYLINIDEKVKILLEKKICKGIIEELTSYLETVIDFNNNFNTITDEEKEDVENWWI
jgi:hypothetical protein